MLSSVSLIIHIDYACHVAFVQYYQSIVFIIGYRIDYCVVSED